MSDVTLSKSELRRQKTRSTILLAAHKSFTEKGYDESTINDILALAKVARATLFAHFPTKLDLLDHLAAEMERISSDKARNLASKKWTAEKKITQFFKLCIDETYQANDFARVLIRHSFNRHPTQDPEEEYGVEAGIATMLANNYASGELDNAIPYPLLVQHVNGAFAGLMLKWVNEAEYPIDAYYPQAAQLAARAICANEK